LLHGLDGFDRCGATGDDGLEQFARRHNVRESLVKSKLFGLEKRDKKEEKAKKKKEKRGKGTTGRGRELKNESQTNERIKQNKGRRGQYKPWPGPR
jgi:hypothetical protein